MVRAKQKQIVYNGNVQLKEAAKHKRKQKVPFSHEFFIMFVAPFNFFSFYSDLTYLSAWEVGMASPTIRRWINFWKENITKNCRNQVSKSPSRPSIDKWLWNMKKKWEKFSCHHWHRLTSCRNVIFAVQKFFQRTRQGSEQFNLWQVVRLLSTENGESRTKGIFPNLS